MLYLGGYEKGVSESSGQKRCDQVAYSISTMALDHRNWEERRKNVTALVIERSEMPTVMEKTVHRIYDFVRYEIEFCGWTWP